MSEIKEFVKNQTPQSNSEITQKKLSFLSPAISLPIFAVIFLVDLFLIYHFTNTSIVFTCSLLVLQVIIAVALDELNYAALLLVAVLEFVLGFILRNPFLVFLTLFVYFAALYVIHTMKASKGMKTA